MALLDQYQGKGKSESQKNKRSTFFQGGIFLSDIENVNLILTF